jgi:hypothetical protein
MGALSKFSVSFTSHLWRPLYFGNAPCLWAFQHMKHSKKFLIIFGGHLIGYLIRCLKSHVFVFAMKVVKTKMLVGAPCRSLKV